MNGDTQHRDGRTAPVAAAALKTRVAGILTASMVISLALAPEALAFARIAANHNETVLTLD
ncbi:MAG: hypothetical protein LC790_03700 [Actinobacteria bacterium]|nr:hypothetical protein [Actinomycetota bacterium]MCA1698040.1 hypothetical protein [Actinomycetota bacterium]